jgi:hypothetical protein
VLQESLRQKKKAAKDAFHKWRREDFQIHASGKDYKTAD